MKHAHDLEELRKRLGKSLHLRERLKALSVRQSAKQESAPEWVIVYRTAHGYCCMYDGAPVEDST